MKRSSKQELRGQSVDELKAQIASLEEEMRKARFEQAIGEARKTSTYRNMRRQIARINTIISEKQGSEVQA